MSIKITSQVWAKERASTKGTGTYQSGFMMLSDLKAMVLAGENAGLNAIGISPRVVNTAKFKGSVIEITPFKLGAKKEA